MANKELGNTAVCIEYIWEGLDTSNMRNMHLSLIISKDDESPASRVLPHQCAAIAPPRECHISQWMRCHIWVCILGKALGGKISKKRLERKSTAAYESCIHLKHPIEMSIALRTR